MRTTPTELPQPNAAQYGEDALSLFDEWSWDTPGSSWKAAHGGTNPPSDPTKRRKYWQDLSLDPSDPDNQIAQYHVLAQINGVWAFKTITMSVQEAMSVNIPNPADLWGHLWDGSGVWGMPVRLFKATESFVTVAGGMGVAIARNDIVSDGPFGQADRLNIQKIMKALNIQ